MFIGWSSLLLRLGYGILFGLLAIQRMDVPSLPSHTEAWDAAYRAYLGYLAMDMLHTNAVLKCFLVIIQSGKNNVCKYEDFMTLRIEKDKEPSQQSSADTMASRIFPHLQRRAEAYKSACKTLASEKTPP